jgi:small subunit ribosomal protein S6
VTTYEILMMLDPERTRELVETSSGTWHSHDAWGRRRLAYPIAHKEEGVYHLVVFDSDAPTLEEVSRVLKIDDAVLRHLATRHIAGSRTSAPRDEAAAVPAQPEPAQTEPAQIEPAETKPAPPEPEPAAAAVSEEAEPEYAGAEEEKQPGEEE